MRAIFLPSIFIFLAIFSLSGCLNTGSGSGSGTGKPGLLAPGMDAEIIQGRNERTFFATQNSNSGSVLIVNYTNHSARLYRVRNGKVIESKNVNTSDILFASDNQAATARGEEGIFEFSETSPEDVANGKSKFPDPTLDVLCFPAPIGAAQSKIGNSSYTDFRIKNESNGHKFQGVRNGLVEDIGGNGKVARQNLLSELIYKKDAFGSFHIYWNITHSSSSQLMYAAFSIPSDETGLESASNLYCQVNPLVKGIDESVVSNRAGSAFSVSQFGNQFASLSQGEASEVAMYVGNPLSFKMNYQYVNAPVAILSAQQYSEAFVARDFRFAIPEQAKITKVTATFTRQGNSFTGCTVANLEEGIHLYNFAAREKLTPDAGKGIRVNKSTYYNQSYVLATSPANGPGVLSPSLVNSPAFAVTVRYHNDTNCSTYATRLTMVQLKIDYLLE